MELASEVRAHSLQTRGLFCHSGAVRAPFESAPQVDLVASHTRAHVRASQPADFRVNCCGSGSCLTTSALARPLARYIPRAPFNLHRTRLAGSLARSLVVIHFLGGAHLNYTRVRPTNALHSSAYRRNKIPLIVTRTRARARFYPTLHEICLHAQARNLISLQVV